MDTLVEIEPIIAGMPSASLTDLARMRLEVISFFLLGFVVCGYFLKLLWNYLARDFERMPRIGYRKALAIFGVAGLFLYVVLTMISGARELMTPGAWTKQGATYVLTESIERDGVLLEKEITEADRREDLEKLGLHLRLYAAEHDGAFPAKRFDPAIPLEVWQARDGQGVAYEYLGEDGQNQVVAYEPGSVGGQRLVLFADWRIESWEWKALVEMVNPQLPRSNEE